MPRLKPADLPRISDRYPCVYLERSRIDCKGNTLLLLDHEGETLLPMTQLAFIMLGPGCTVSLAAVSLAAECGASLLWVGVRFYADGASLTASNRLVIRQAELSRHTEGAAGGRARPLRQALPGREPGLHLHEAAAWHGGPAHGRRI